MTAPIMGPKLGIRFVTPTTTEISPTYCIPTAPMKMAFAPPTMTASRMENMIYLTRILLQRLRKVTTWSYHQSDIDALRRRLLPCLIGSLAARRYTDRISASKTLSIFFPIPLEVARMFFREDVRSWVPVWIRSSEEAISSLSCVLTSMPIMLQFAIRPFKVLI